MRVRITEGAWKDTEGEYVRDEPSGGEGVAGKVVVRMPGERLVEFPAERVEFIADEPDYSDDPEYPRTEGE